MSEATEATKATAPTAALSALPREAWSAHPHWPDQVLLLGSHANFRDISAYLVAVTQAAIRPAEAGDDGPPLPSLAAISSLYRRWIAGMRSHEAYEERKLYPYLTRRWGLDFAAAEAGHEALHDRHAEVLDALAEARASGEITPALVEAFRAHDQVLNEHLDLEEELVIPALLSLPPREFHRYTMLSITALLDELPQ